MSDAFPRSTPLFGSWTKLRPLHPSDYDFLYRLSLRGDALWRWRYHGATPSPQHFEATLWDGVLAQFVIETRSDERIGLVSLYNAEMVGGHAFVAILVDSSYSGKAWPLESLLLLVDYAFSTWPFRKLYFEFIEPNAAPFARTARRHLREEARFVGHDFADNVYVDRVVCSLAREDWNLKRQLFLPREYGDSR